MALRTGPQVNRPRKVEKRSYQDFYDYGTVQDNPTNTVESYEFTKDLRKITQNSTGAVTSFTFSTDETIRINRFRVITGPNAGNLEIFINGKSFIGPETIPAGTTEFDYDAYLEGTITTEELEIRATRTIAGTLSISLWGVTI